MTTGPARDDAAGDSSAVAELPHDRMTVDIARHLEDSGVYRVRVAPGDPQRLVDVRWAALGAGRMMGRKVYVTVSRMPIGSKAPVTVRISCTRAGRAIPVQRDRD